MISSTVIIICTFLPLTLFFMVYFICKYHIRFTTCQGTQDRPFCSNWVTEELLANNGKAWMCRMGPLNAVFYTSSDVHGTQHYSDCTIVKYKALDDLDSCHICLDEFTSSTYVRLSCHHCFHKECIKSWLSIKLTCPVCNVKVKTMNLTDVGENGRPIFDGERQRVRLQSIS